MSGRRDRLKVTELVQGLENNPVLIPEVGISWESQGGFHCTPTRSPLVPEASVLPLGKLGMDEPMTQPQLPASRQAACVTLGLWSPVPPFLEKETPPSSLFPDYQRKGLSFAILHPIHAELLCGPGTMPGTGDTKTWRWSNDCHPLPLSPLAIISLSQQSQAGPSSEAPVKGREGEAFGQRHKG